jgi:hypothetical protein
METKLRKAPIATQYLSDPVFLKNFYLFLLDSYYGALGFTDTIFVFLTYLPKRNQGSRNDCLVSQLGEATSSFHRDLPSELSAGVPC